MSDPVLDRPVRATPTAAVGVAHVDAAAPPVRLARLGRRLSQDQLARR
jgi:hypothetical protein